MSSMKNHFHEEINAIAFHGDEQCCERCGEPTTSANVEAFELSGQAVCEDCADEVFAEGN